MCTGDIYLKGVVKIASTESHRYPKVSIKLSFTEASYGIREV